MENKVEPVWSTEHDMAYPIKNDVNLLLLQIVENNLILLDRNFYRSIDFKDDYEFQQNHIKNFLYKYPHLIKELQQYRSEIIFIENSFIIAIAGIERKIKVPLNKL
uniref:Uncharacterized protein n=1 Tax=Glossina pallidipes TaxID=7398 RepID=A0A1A9ZKY6_GLOPL